MKKWTLLLLCLLVACLFVIPASAESILQNSPGCLSGSTTVMLYIPEYHRVSIRCGNHGSLLVDDTQFDGNSQFVLTKEGSFTITAIPDEGYDLSTFTVSNAEGVTLEGNTLYVSKLKTDLTIQISFVAHVHTPETVPGTAATFDTPGLTDGSVCSSCGAVLEEQYPTPALGYIHLAESEHCLQITTAEKELQLNAEILPENARDTKILWSSSDDTIATVKNGLVTAYQSGTVTITAATESGSQAACTIDVLDSSAALVLPQGLKTIDAEAFIDISADIVVLPDGCTQIGERAFADSRVKRIVIPSSCTSIAANAFSGCSKLTICGEEGSCAAQYARKNGFSFLNF